MKALRIKAARETLNAMYRALDAQRMERASFSLTGNMGSKEDTEAIKEATRLFRNTWIQQPLIDAIVTLEVEILRAQWPGEHFDWNNNRDYILAEVWRKIENHDWHSQWMPLPDEWALSN